MKSETPERPMAREYEFLEDGATCRLSTEGPKKFTVSMPVEFDDNLREGALAAELLRVVAERDEAVRKGEEVCCAYGNALVEIHDLKRGRDEAQAGERQRIRRALLEVIADLTVYVQWTTRHDGTGESKGVDDPFISAADLRAALDQIAPEEGEEVSGGQ